MTVDWRERLAFFVAVHDVVVAGDRVLGGVSAASEESRLDVVDVIDAALAQGVSETEVDAELDLIRSERCPC